MYFIWAHTLMPVCEHSTQLHFLKVASIHLALRCSDAFLWRSESDKAASRAKMWQSCCCRGMQTQAVLKLARELWPLQNVQELQLKKLNKHIILSMGKLNENVILGCTPNNFRLKLVY